MLSPGDIAPLIASGGYWAVGVTVALESMGIPVPGETMLIAAALYAGTTHDLDIGPVIAAAAGDAITGDNIGFWLGRALGYRLLLRYGRYIELSARRIEKKSGKAPDLFACLFKRRNSPPAGPSRFC